MKNDEIDLGGIPVEVVRKDIKNVHLSVYPPLGKVRIAAPLRMKLDTIRVFAISKLAWIRQQQHKVTAQEREAPREYIERESHYVWGKRYLLKVVEKEAASAIELKHSHLLLQVRPGTTVTRRQEIIDEWYRNQLKAAVPPLLENWQRVIGVKVNRVFIQRMKTKWGSCTPATASNRQNTDLARKPRPCLVYIVVHELVHLLEPTHNTRFTALMDQFLPNWRIQRQTLNRLPVRHENWLY